MSRLLTTTELIRALSLRDLTDPAAGPHAMQLLLAEIHAALPVPVQVHQASPIVSVADNYDRLGYPEGGAARDERYTRYVCDTALLRSQTSAMRSEPLGCSGRVISTRQKFCATSQMRVSSVATITSLKDFANWHCSTTCWMRGLPAMSASGLPGKRVEANRAGMMPRIFTGLN